nr:solute carrier family 22 member 8-like [Procambarus clarkii]
MSPVPERSRRDSKTLTVGYGTTSDQHLEPVITFDEVLEKLGMGRWNLPVILGLSFWTMNMSPHVLGGVFMAPNIDVTCQVPEGGFPKVLQQEGTNQTRLYRYTVHHDWFENWHSTIPESSNLHMWWTSYIFTYPVPHDRTHPMDDRGSFTVRCIRFLQTRRMRRTTLGMYGCHLVLGLAFYGISLSGQTLGADLFSFMALAGAAEVLAKFLAAVSIERFGRKIISTVSFSTTGVAMLAAAFVPADLVWLVTTLSLAGKLTISMCYTTVFLMTSELFPTEVRTRGLGTSTVMAQIGSISAAYLVDYLGKLASWAPSAVFGVTSLLAAGITRSFRETRGAALIDTVSALETQVFKPHALDASALKTHAADTQVQTEE